MFLIIYIFLRVVIEIESENYSNDTHARDRSPHVITYNLSLVRLHKRKRRVEKTLLNYSFPIDSFRLVPL